MCNWRYLYGCGMFDSSVTKKSRFQYQYCTKHIHLHLFPNIILGKFTGKHCGALWHTTTTSTLSSGSRIPKFVSLFRRRYNSRSCTFSGTVILRNSLFENERGKREHKRLWRDGKEERSMHALFYLEEAMQWFYELLISSDMEDRQAYAIRRSWKLSRRSITIYTINYFQSSLKI